MELAIGVGLLIVLVLIYAWNCIDPKLDWNYETGERILWYNNPLGIYERKSLVLWKKKT